MNTVIVLSGGKGTRMKNIVSCPKQYYEIDNKPIIGYCLDTFENNKHVDAVIIVADTEWYDYIGEYILHNNITKFKGFAESGETRQLSVFNALKMIKNFMKEEDVVLVHDAARPFVTDKIIEQCFNIPAYYDGVMPVLPVTNTMYQSADGKEISQLLPRKEIFSGQAPESFVYGKYMNIHEENLIGEIAKSNGSSELAYRYGMKIALIEGDSRNFKITNPEDIRMAKMYLNENKNED